MNVYLHNAQVQANFYKKRTSNLDNLKKLFPVWLNLHRVGRYDGFFEKLLKEGLFDFNDIVDCFKEINKLKDFLAAHEIIRGLIEHNCATKQNIQYLIESLSDVEKLDNLFGNAYLTEFILKNSILDEFFVCMFDKLLKNSEFYAKIGVHTVFDFIDKCWVQTDKIDLEIKNSILTLNELNRHIYKLNSFDKLTQQDKLDLYECMKDAEFAQERLNYILENHVEHMYSYNELKSYLLKKEKKTQLNV